MIGRARSPNWVLRVCRKAACECVLCHLGEILKWHFFIFQHTLSEERKNENEAKNEKSGVGRRFGCSGNGVFLYQGVRAAPGRIHYPLFHAAGDAVCLSVRHKMGLGGRAYPQRFADFIWAERLKGYYSRSGGGLHSVGLYLGLYRTGACRCFEKQNKARWPFVYVGLPDRRAASVFMLLPVWLDPVG